MSKATIGGLFFGVSRAHTDANSQRGRT
jgi:hypothetical protein